MVLSDTVSLLNWLLGLGLGYQTAPWCDEAVMAHARMSAHTYVTHYLRTIRAAALDDGSV